MPKNTNRDNANQETKTHLLGYLQNLFPDLQITPSLVTLFPTSRIPYIWQSSGTYDTPSKNGRKKKMRDYSPAERAALVDAIANGHFRAVRRQQNPPALDFTFVEVTGIEDDLTGIEIGAANTNHTASTSTIATGAPQAGVADVLSFTITQHAALGSTAHEDDQEEDQTGLAEHPTIPTPINPVTSSTIVGGQQNGAPDGLSVTSPQHASFGSTAHTDDHEDDQTGLAGYTIIHTPISPPPSSTTRGAHQHGLTDSLPVTILHHATLASTAHRDDQEEDQNRLAEYTTTPIPISAPPIFNMGGGQHNGVADGVPVTSPHASLGSTAYEDDNEEYQTRFAEDAPTSTSTNLVPSSTANGGGLQPRVLSNTFPISTLGKRTRSSEETLGCSTAPTSTRTGLPLPQWFTRSGKFNTFFEVYDIWFDPNANPQHPNFLAKFESYYKDQYLAISRVAPADEEDFVGLACFLAADMDGEEGLLLLMRGEQWNNIEVFSSRQFVSIEQVITKIGMMANIKAIGCELDSEIDFYFRLNWNDPAVREILCRELRMAGGMVTWRPARVMG